MGLVTFLMISGLFPLLATGEHLKIGGLAIRGTDVLMEQWAPTFSVYLSDALEEHNFTVELVPLDFATVYTVIERREVDFIHVNPSMFSCMESEFGARAIASQNNIRLGTELSRFGGAFIARSDRFDLTKLEDIQDRVVEAVSISGLGACQMQWRELQLRGLDFLNDPKEVRFAFNQKKIVRDVISGAVDIGFVRTDMWETMEQNGEIPAGKIKVLEPRNLGPDSIFPFETSTQLYPEWPLGVLPHVNEDISKLIVNALFSLNGTMEAALAGKYSRWGPPLSYLPLNYMLRGLGLMVPSASGQDSIDSCIRSVEFYDAIVCPRGFLKLGREDLSASCDGVNSTACPDNYICICKPCLRVPENEYTVNIAIEKTDSNILVESHRPCEKLQVCEKQVAYEDKVCVIVNDNFINIRSELGLDTDNDTFSVQVRFYEDQQDLNGGWVAAKRGGTEGVYIAELPRTGNGIHIVEVMINGNQIDVSPTLLEVDIPEDSSSLDDDTYTDAVVVGLTLGTFLLVILLAFAFTYVHRQRQLNKPVDFRSKFPEMVKQGYIAGYDGDDLSLSYEKLRLPLEFKRRHIHIVDIVNKGSFGHIWKAVVNEITETSPTPGFIVAAKTLDAHKASNEGQELLAEAAIMAQVSGHPNLVALVGVITAGEPLILLMEYCECGSLLTCLKDFVDSPKMFSLYDKLIMGEDIARGMEHLISNRIIHRDLACRNILLKRTESSDRYQCKVADFGLSRASAQDSDLYYRSSRGVFPLRWTDPETMESLKFTEASDIWSFGVLMIEVLQDGKQPYDTMTNAEVMTYTIAGGRHKAPPGCDSRLYALLLSCWCDDHEARPTFSSMCNSLRSIAGEYINSQGSMSELSINTDAESSFPTHSSGKGNNNFGTVPADTLEIVKTSRALQSQGNNVNCTLESEV